MLDVAIRRSDGTTAVDLGRRAAPPLPVSPALAPILPGGLRRGATISVTGSVSLLLALLGAASAGGAWCALVGFPRISAEAAVEFGIDLSRLAIVPPGGLSGNSTANRGSGSGSGGRGGSDWSTAVGALLDAVDVVAARPPRLVPGEVRRLAARARSHDAVLVPYLTGADTWPGADVHLSARDGQWTGIGAGTGRLVARRVEVSAQGRGTAARPRSATLWLPARGGGVTAVEPTVGALPISTLPAVVELPELTELAG